ncbi:MAG: hypothetical protein ACTSP3_06955 [Candidatus Heimdallarchaeaceae archaeon]
MWYQKQTALEITFHSKIEEKTYESEEDKRTALIADAFTDPNSIFFPH